jgi:hypothetical protein
MSVLEDAGYVTVTKSGRGHGSSTTYRITELGRDAYCRHLAALAALTQPR